MSETNITITVKVSKVPGAPREVSVAKGSTLGDVLDTYKKAFNESTENYELRRGDETVTLDYIPSEGDRFFLVQQIKGNR